MNTGTRTRRAVSLRRWRDELLIATALAALAAAIALGGWAFRLDRLFYDLGQTLWSRPAPADIVIVAIDDASVQAIGRWPWSRAVHATLLERIAAAKPRAVALDLVLSEADPRPELDALLAAAMRRAGAVVLPVAWQDMGTGMGAGMGRAHITALEPTPVLRATAVLGAASPGVDGDGVLREAFMHFGPIDNGSGAEVRYPNLALALLQAGGEQPHPRTQALAESDGAAGSDGPNTASRAAQRSGRFSIRYLGPPNTVQRVSYAEVLAGTVPPERLAGRYVLVGMTAQGLGDTLATPVNSRHLAMPGIEVHANTLHTLRSGTAIATLHEGALAVVSALAVALLLAAFVRFGPRVALPLAVACVPLAVVAALLVLQAGWWISPVPFALAAVLAYPLWSWRRLERAVQRLDQEIAQLAQAGESGPGHAGSPQPAPDITPTIAALRSRSTDGDALDSRLHALRRAGALVRDARRFLGEALAALPTAVLVADAQARVTLANPRAAALFDVDGADELLGLDLVRLLGEFTPSASPDEGFDWAAALAALQPGSASLAVEVEAKTENPSAGASGEGRMAGKSAYVVHVAAMNLQDPQQRLVVTVSDVEPVKQAQRSREEVLAFVSHDLRSPASAIVLLADLQLQGRVNTPMPELLAEVKRLAGRTLALSEGLVRAAQVQTQALNREPLSLATLVEESLADLRARALAAGLQLQAELATPEAVVTVDRLLMTRAVGNLLGNALRHGPPGSTVTLRAAVQQGRLHLAVRDQGPGLSAAQMAQLARGDEGAAVRDASGVGLGLLFVQRVARRHGGRLQAQLPAGGGAHFEIEVPA